MEKSLSVLVLALNEERSIIQCLEGLFHACQGCPGPYEIIVVNDGSTDRTLEFAQEFAVNHPQIRVVSNEKNLGFGGAFKRGLQEAKMNYCTLVGAVNENEKNSLRQIYSEIGKADLILSYVANPETRSPFRRIMSTAYVKLVNFLFGYRLKFYNGANIYPTKKLRERDFTNSHGFYVEILIRLLDEGFSYKEVPLVLQPRRHKHSRAFRPKNVILVVWTLVRIYVNRFLKAEKRKNPKESGSLQK